MAAVGSDKEVVQAALRAVLASKYFVHAEGLSNLLRYLVEETVAGRGSALKELTVGIDVFGRGPSFDPKNDGIVRVQVSRLRAKLREYYAAEGQHDSVVISIPTGSYAAEFLPANGRSKEPETALTSRTAAWPTRRVVLAAGGLAGVVGIGIVASQRQQPAARVSSVAVLPFRNLTGDPEKDYLADALTDHLITNLGKLPGLRVMSRTTSMSFAGTKKALLTVARELKVDTLVEGSMAEVEGNIRVNVNLVEVREQERNLFSRTLEHGARDFAGLQDAMYRQVAAQIQPGAMSPPERKSANPDAYTAYLKGRHFAGRGTEESIQQAIRWFDQATSLDPQMALAKTGRAHAFIALTDFFMLPAESLARAKENAQEAVRIDPSLGDAYVARGAAALFYDRDPQAAETDLRRALQMNPNAAEAHTMFATLCAAMGRFDEAIAASRRALQCDPLSPVAYMWHLFITLLSQRYEQVEQEGRGALQLFPEHPLINLWVGSSKALRGDLPRAEAHFAKAAKFDQIPLVPLWIGMMRALANDRKGALADLAKAQKIAERRYICPYEVASLHAVLGDMDEAYRWLERGLADRCLCFTWLKIEPWLAPLRADPRFPALAAKVGLWNKVRSF